MIDGFVTSPDGPRFQIRPRTAALILAALLLIITGLRIVSSDYSLWFDELASLFFASKTHGQLWGPWLYRETNPPLFYSMLRAWQGMGAESVVQLRLLTIAAATFGLVVIFLYCKRNFGVAAAIAAVILCGASAQHLYYSQLLRGYIFGFDGVLVSLLGLTMLLQDRRFVTGSLLYILGALLAVHSHATLFLWPLAATAGGLLAFWQWGSFEKQRPFVWLLGSNLVLLVLSSWQIYMTMKQMEFGAGNIGWINEKTIRGMVSLLTQNLLLFRDTTGLERLIFTGMFGLSVILATSLTWRNAAARLCFATMVVAVALFVAFEWIRPILVPQTIFWISLFPTVLIAAGIGALKSSALRWGWLAVLSLGLLLNSVYVRAKMLPFEAWRETLRTVNSDPAGVLLVKHESMAIVGREACKIEFREAECPVPIYVMTSDQPSDSWGRGQFSGTMISPSELASRLPLGARVYSLRHVFYDALDTLGVPHRHDQLVTPLGELSGPYAPSDLVYRGGAGGSNEEVVTAAAAQ